MMRRNDIENIARILRKRSPVRVGTIVGFENDGKVVQVRFHDTKLPEGQFERKLACEGIIEGSVFTLIQPNFRRPVSDLVDIEKEVGAGGLKGLTLPLVGFETYPEGSENPDCIIGLFELPGGEIYREVLAEKSHDILIPGYGTFHSQKVFGQDVIKRIDVVPWFGPLKIGEHFRLATITNKLKELTTIDGQTVSGFPYVDKIASIRSDTDIALYPDAEFERLNNDVLLRRGVFNPEQISEDLENRHLIYTSGAMLFFCEGISAFEYWEHPWSGKKWFSQSPYPLYNNAVRGFWRSRVFNVFNEDGIYTKRYGAVPWLCAWFYPDPYGMGTTSALYKIHGYFAVEKISYDLSKNTVKVTGSSNWLDNPEHYPYSGFLGSTSYEIEFLNDPEIPAGLAIVNRSGVYLGYREVIPASEYENTSLRVYQACASVSDPISMKFEVPYRPQINDYYRYTTRSLYTLETIKASGNTVNLIDENITLDTQEVQVLLGYGSYRPYYIVDIPERMNEIATPDGLVHLWFVTKPDRTPVMIPHLESNDTGIVQSFLTPEEWEKGEKDKTEIELKLSNIDLPVDAQVTDCELTRLSPTFRNPFFVKDIENTSISKTDAVRDVAGLLGLGIMNWNYDVRVFNDYGAYGANYKSYDKKLDAVQIKEIYFKGTVIDNKPYKMPSFDFTDPNLLMDHSYGERSLDDYNYNPANGGLSEQINTYKTTMPKYDTGANATYRYDPDDLIVEVDHVDVYKITGASYDHWTGFWNWTWESEPCRTIPGSQVEKVEPYPRIRVPILAEELTQISGRWHLPRLHIYYKRLKAGTYGLNVVPYFYIHFRNVLEALAELSNEDAAKVFFPNYFNLFNPRRRNQIEMLKKLLPVPELEYGTISFPETDDPLFNAIRNDMTGIVGVGQIKKFVTVSLTESYYDGLSDYKPLKIKGPSGRDEAYFLPLYLEGRRNYNVYYRRLGSSEQRQNFDLPEEAFQGVQMFPDVNDGWYELPSNFKLTRLRFDRAKLVFPKLMLQDDLSSTVINLEKYGIRE